jgi:hypothetical protein
MSRAGDAGRGVRGRGKRGCRHSMRREIGLLMDNNGGEVFLWGLLWDESRNG